MKKERQRQRKMRKREKRQNDDVEERRSEILVKDLAK